jgi:hypothetical protein
VPQPLHTPPHAACHSTAGSLDLQGDVDCAVGRRAAAVCQGVARTGLWILQNPGRTTPRALPVEGRRRRLGRAGAAPGVRSYEVAIGQAFSTSPPHLRYPVLSDQEPPDQEPFNFVWSPQVRVPGQQRPPTVRGTTMRAQFGEARFKFQTRTLNLCPAYILS